MRREGMTVDPRYLGEPRGYPERMARLEAGTDDAFGVFQLVHEPGPQAEHDGHKLSMRYYPDLQPPASFVDCWTCYVTWEIGK